MRWWTLASISALAAAAVATEALVVRAGTPADGALLDLAAGLALLLPVLCASALGRGCRRWCAAAAGFWFVATLAALDTTAGHAAAQVATAWLAPLTVALLGAPGPWPASRSARGVAALVWVRAAVPIVAALPWATALTGLMLAAVALPGAIRPGAFRSTRATAVALGLATAAAPGLHLIHLAPTRPDLLVAGCVAACGVAMTAARTAPLARSTGAERLVIELGRSASTRSHQQLLAAALGDPGVRLLYRLAPGLPLLDHRGHPVSVPELGREVTLLTGAAPHARAVAVAVEHDRHVLRDARVRAAAAAAGSLLARRLQVAADAAQQAADVAAARNRLVAAEDAERRRFARSVAAGPGRSLEHAVAALAGILAEPVDLPADVMSVVLQAREQAVAAGQELIATVRGDPDAVLARHGLRRALTDLATRTGASMWIDPGLEAALAVMPDVARAAWYVAAEGLANALRHAGSARLRLEARCEGPFLVVMVSDDGVGGANPSGGGLTGLQARAEELGGRLDVGAAPGGGTVVRAEFPLARSPVNQPAPMRSR